MIPKGITKMQGVNGTKAIAFGFSVKAGVRIGIAFGLKECIPPGLPLLVLSQ